MVTRPEHEELPPVIKNQWNRDIVLGLVLFAVVVLTVVMTIIAVLTQSLTWIYAALGLLVFGLFLRGVVKAASKSVELEKEKRDFEKDGM